MRNIPSTAATTTDAPYNFPHSSTPVYNWDRSYYGSMSITYAIQQSRNVPAVKALEKVGLKQAKKFLNGLGSITQKWFTPTLSRVTLAILATNTEPAVRKWQLPMLLLPMAVPITKPSYVSRVVFSDGTTKEFESEGTRAMKATTAYMMTDMMKTVLLSGTGTNAAISGIYQAGKTGTSNYADNEIGKLTKIQLFKYCNTG